MKTGLRAGLLLAGAVAVMAHGADFQQVLFNGRTLDGWEGDAAVFRVDDGAIVAGSLDAALPRNEFLSTTREFNDFDLSLCFMVKGQKDKANAGVQIRSRRIPNNNEMIGYQADIGQQYWGSLYDESRRRKVLAHADLNALRPRLSEDGWNTYRIRCEGRRIRLWINGLQTVDYIEPDTAVEQNGLIALQVHGGPPCEVRYKDIVLRDLSADIPFTARALNKESDFEAAGIMDIDGDGRQDIVCGGSWYQAPGWTPHPALELKPINQYYNDFANLPVDVDRDGRVDIVSVAWFSKAISWFKNPGPADGFFPPHVIDTPGNMETAMLVDLNGDGRDDVLPNINGAPAWYEQTDAPDPARRWTRHDIDRRAAGHGIGAGDVNGDGRCDVLAPKGWLEQPAESGAEWIWHGEFDLGQNPSVPILAHDVDGDGDADIIWGHAHNYGLQWLEQQTVDGRRAWTPHEIDTSWSQVHFLLLTDLDADGEAELVTGKRFHAHNGHDPGAAEPPCVYAYRFDRADRTWRRLTISAGAGIGFGISTMSADLDGDGDPDLVAPGKGGLFLLTNGWR